MSSSNFSAGEGKQTGDIVSSKSSTKDEYYRYMLLQAKLNNLKDDNAPALLKVQSEREAIEMAILQNLINVTESSPEFSQIVDITGSRDRYEQARILSEVVYDKARAEKILSWYTPSADTLKSHFTVRTEQAYKVRTSGADAMNRTVNGANASATAVFNAYLPGAPAAPGGGGGAA
jgi:hypothetical protein